MSDRRTHARELIAQRRAKAFSEKARQKTAKVLPEGYMKLLNELRTKIMVGIRCACGKQLRMADQVMVNGKHFQPLAAQCDGCGHYFSPHGHESPQETQERRSEVYEKYVTETVERANHGPVEESEDSRKAYDRAVRRVQHLAAMYRKGRPAIAAEPIVHDGPNFNALAEATGESFERVHTWWWKGRNIYAVKHLWDRWPAHRFVRPRHVSEYEARDFIGLSCAVKGKLVRRHVHESKWTGKRSVILTWLRNGVDHYQEVKFGSNVSFYELPT